MTTDDEIFRGFVFEGRRYRKEEIERAARTVERQLTSSERKHANDALLRKLDAAKKTRKNKSHAQLLDVPAISTPVNILIIVNLPWITETIATTIEHQPALRRYSVEELHSIALTGHSTNQGTVSGAMNSILEYNYAKFGVSAFTHYLARAITNALTPTSKQKKVQRRLYSRMQQLQDFDQPGVRWTDRASSPPDAAVNHELVEIIETVIPRLPSPQQRFTARLMLKHLLATGELPIQQEVADQQIPPVTRERGRQIMQETLKNLRKHIAARFPQFATDEAFGASFADLRRKDRPDHPNGFRR